MTTQHPDTPETGITPGGTSGAFRDVLSKDHARRGRPPLHFVDMTPEQRVEKVYQHDTWQALSISVYHSL